METLYDKIASFYPELKGNVDLFRDGTIELVNEADGAGDYIKAWNYSKPIPEGMKIGK
jgi:hypothetical protein